MKKTSLISVSLILLTLARTISAEGVNAPVSGNGGTSTNTNTGATNTNTNTGTTNTNTGTANTNTNTNTGTTTGTTTSNTNTNNNNTTNTNDVSNIACPKDYCARCTDGHGCTKCIGKKKVPQTWNSAPRCGNDITEPNCKVWMDPPHEYCKQCDWGYLVNENNACVGARDKSCIQGSKVSDQRLCTICSKTLPNWERTKCTDKLDIPNCRWGFRQGQLEACAYCKKGYSVYGYGCVPNCVEGCATCGKAWNGTMFIQVCQECDWRRGWWMTSQNKCTGANIVYTWGSALIALMITLGLLGN